MSTSDLDTAQPLLPLVAPAKAGVQGRVAKRLPLSSRLRGNDGSEDAALRVTATGGRNATTRHILPKTALAVGMPSTPAPEGWRWSPLTSLARLEFGTYAEPEPSRILGGDIPWIGIQDAKAHHGRRIYDTAQKVNELGIANSSARVLPENTVCLSRTASVGDVVVTGRPMATSQDFVNWVCSEHLDHDLLKYLFIAEDEDLLRFRAEPCIRRFIFPK